MAMWPTIGPKEKNLYARVGFLLRRAQQLFATFAATDLDLLQLTLPQAEALLAIGSAPNSDQATVARILGLDAATITLVIDGLERKKVATRGAHEDRRRRTLTLTTRGKRLLADVRPRLKKASDRFLQPLSRSAASELLRDLAVLAANPESSAAEWLGLNDRSTGQAGAIDELLRGPGFLIRRAVQVCSAMFHTCTERHGISTQQYATLSAIAGFPDLDQAALSDVTWSGKSTAVPLLRALEARGLIVRVGAEGDGRRRVFRLQEQGETLLRSVYEDVRRSEEAFLAPLPAARALAVQERLREIVLAHGALHMPRGASRPSRN